MKIEQIIAIAVGGAFGASLRYIIAKNIQDHCQFFFPLGIFAVNFIGSFLMGLLTIYLAQKLALGMIWRSAILIGFLGGFTTFSSFALDSVNLLHDGYTFTAFFYMFASLIVCVAAAWLGIILGRVL